MKHTFFELIERYNAAPAPVPFRDERRGMLEEIPFTGALLIEGALEILNEGDPLAEMPPLILAAQTGNQRALEEVVADLAASYRRPNHFSEGKYFAVDCEEEVPFTDEARIRADIAAHPAFANFGVVSDDWYVCANWVGADARPNAKAPVVTNVPTLVLQGEFDAPTWLKPAIAGGIVGGLSALITGFSYGGWMLGSSAEAMAEQRSTTAVTEALVPVCIAQCKVDPEAAGKLTSLKALTSPYQQREFVMKSGWATMPASDTPNDDLAAACAEVLVKPLQT